MKNTEYRFKQISLLAEALEAEIKLTNKKFIEDFTKIGTDITLIYFAFLQVNGTMLEEALVIMIKAYPGQPILEKFLEDFLRRIYKKVEL